MPIPTVNDIMTTQVVALQVDTTLDKAAATMREQAIGDVVVSDGERHIGLVTDRDIVVRAVAEGRDPASTTLGSIVSQQLITVRPEDSAHSAALLMRDHAVRRVLVLDDERGLVGILSIGDLAAEIDPESVLG